MYTSYFGLSEAPFLISPDPRFLYMSSRHREAMAHLIYGIKEGGGFVQLTGEVGTGKTTLCRCLLLQIPEEVDVALILNPQINQQELLGTICDELKIEHPKDASTSVLLGLLNKHLLETYAAGRRTVLIIDEAQLLTHAVLEEVRILTNLETTRHKLLQIILIGQPELSQTLGRADLRQLAQRITARYHLQPLNAEDTGEYVKYRLAVVGCHRPLFTLRALHQIYKYSNGIPRLINVICDRCLLGAYTTNAKKVTAATVHNAAKEVLGESKRGGWTDGWWAPALAVLVGLAVLFWFPQPRDKLAEVAGYASSWVSAEAKKILESEPMPTEVAIESVQQPNPSSGGQKDESGVKETAADALVEQTEIAGFTPVLSLERVMHIAGVKEPEEEQQNDLLTTMTTSTNDYRQVFGSLVTQWAPESLVANIPLNCKAIEQLGLRCLAKSGSWADLGSYNRAAVLLLRYADDEFPVLITRLGSDYATLKIGATERTFDRSEIEKYWSGEYILLWRPPPLQYEEISVVSRGPDVLWLRQALNRVAQQNGSAVLDVLSADYDEALRDRVIAFQKNHDIQADGIVGVDTLIRLNTLLNETGIPLLIRTPTG